VRTLSRVTRRASISLGVGGGSGRKRSKAGLESLEQDTGGGASLLVNSVRGERVAEDDVFYSTDARGL